MLLPLARVSRVPRVLPIIVVLLLVLVGCTGERPVLSSETVPAEPQPEPGQTANDGERAFELPDDSGTTVRPSPPVTLAGRSPQPTAPPNTFPSDVVPFSETDIAPLVDDGEARALRTPTGVIADVISEVDDGYLILTPCANEVVVPDGEVIGAAHVVLDAGHGGSEPGAIGPQGSWESQINLAVAERVEALLTEAGVSVVQTRTKDYRISILSRTAIANSVQPLAFVSIHHNAAPDGPIGKPGAETYYQVLDPESKRLAGLIYEEAFEEFSKIDIAWLGDTDAGVKVRLGESGDDYYGVLRRSAGVPSVLTELLYLSNPPEEALLITPAFQQTEAEVITRAILRFLSTDDPGSGFVEGYPRVAPAGGGGGTNNCIDPPLN